MEAYQENGTMNPVGKEEHMMTKFFMVSLLCSLAVLFVVCGLAVV